MIVKIKDQNVKRVFESYPEPYKAVLAQIREEIFATAKSNEAIGQLEETLKWGQLSYITAESKSGTTIRIDRFGEDKVALFFHCQTTLVASFREMFPELEYSKNRAVVFEPNEKLPLVELRTCVQMALTYHLNKK